MGFYSINLSKKKINIYTFEPIIENFIQLEKNILVNKIYNIKTYNCALSNIKKLVTMWVPDKNRTGGFAIY
jgi:FkbM family methyltransferase